MKNAPVILLPQSNAPAPCPTCLGYGWVDALRPDPRNCNGFVADRLPCVTCDGVGTLFPSAATA